MKLLGKSSERRRGSSPVGAHPERRVIAPARRLEIRAGGRPHGATAVVLPPVVNMFERPDAASPVVSQAILGTTVTVVEHPRRWALIETPDRYLGWIRSEALGHIVAGRGAYPAGEHAVEVSSLLANLYREPDVTAASPLAVASILTRLEVTGDTREWLRVRLPDGREAWLQKGDTRPIPKGPAAAGKSRGDESEGPRTSPDPQAVAATALRFLGLPYLWGGTTTFGLDCSGLAQLAYRAHRFLLPRDADLQYGDPRLESVSRTKIRAGDLVFFGPGTRGITHVGIAIGAESFVSATTYRCPTVRIDRLKDPYWKRLYRGGRRIRT